ncbi:MAG: DNA repair protein RadA [bacterium]
MPKQETIYTCSKCGAQFSKWQGRCSECGAWSTVSEEPSAVPAEFKKRGNFFPSNASVIDLNNIKGKDEDRIKVGIEEVDRVLGGGIVPGSLVLLGGEPGIGKSTLVLQVAEKLAQPIPLPSPRTGGTSHPFEAGGAMGGVLYASGEESAEQIKMRMDRLGIVARGINFLSETNVDVICGAIQKYKPSLAIIDSIQMLYSNEVESECGSVAQIRACASKLMGVAKAGALMSYFEEGNMEGENSCTVENHIQTIPSKGKEKKPSIIIIGHITKDGAVAGPKTLEHLVDTVLYLEGERFHTYRILRAVKNRFGSTNEIGVFEMASKGLLEIKNPSALFMEEHKEKLPGTIVTSVMEGTRPFLIEIQALTATTNFGYPQRKVSGFDLNRLQLLLAVLQKRLGLNFSNKDVYLNIAGGFKIQEPSADLAVCIALISALKNESLEFGTAAFGEVGLGGEIRSVSQPDKRINEARKLGFKNIICPCGKKTIGECLEFGTLREVAAKVFK